QKPSPASAKTKRSWWSRRFGSRADASQSSTEYVATLSHAPALVPSGAEVQSTDNFPASAAPRAKRRNGEPGLPAKAERRDVATPAREPAKIAASALPAKTQATLTYPASGMLIPSLPGRRRRRSFGLFLSFLIFFVTPVALSAYYLYAIAADQYV